MSTKSRFIKKFNELNEELIGNSDYLQRQYIPKRSKIKSVKKLTTPMKRQQLKELKLEPDLGDF